MTPKTFILGTRGSQLALRQSEMVRDALLQHFPTLQIELKIIKTKGDKLISPLMPQETRDFSRELLRKHCELQR